MSSLMPAITNRRLVGWYQFNTNWVVHISHCRKPEPEIAAKSSTISRDVRKHSVASFSFGTSNNRRVTVPQ